MQLGFAQLEAGMCRPKNVIATYIKNLADFVLGTLATLFIGYALAYGQIPLIDKIESWKFFFHLVFQATASTIVSGAMAERINILGYAALTTFLSGVVYAMAVKITWGGGILTSGLEPGFHDFAGSGVVHLLGGSAALAGTSVLGARSGRWEMPEKFVCHSVPQVLSGAMLLWIGWYGFNPGSTGAMSSMQDALTASNAAMVTTISGATAACVALMGDLAISNGEDVDVVKFINSLLGGLVAITAGSDVLSPWAAMLTGCIAAFIFTISKVFVIRCQIDDVVDAISVHGACGMWGCISVGLFHPDLGLFCGGGGALLLSQVIGVITIFSLGFGPVYVVCELLKSKGWLRSTEEEEAMGIDMYLFKLTAYVRDEHFEYGDGGVGYGAGTKNGYLPTMPPLRQLVDTLRKQLNMADSSTLASVLDKAAEEFGVPPNAYTLQAKANGVWQVLEEQNGDGGHNA
jgi:Amt family ammonium transporter